MFRGDIPASGVITSIAYDLDGRPEIITDARGKQTRLGYDGIGNLSSVTDPTGTVERRGFDHMGNVIWSAVYAGGSAPAEYRTPVESDPGLKRASEFEYDAMGRLHVTRVWHLDRDGRIVGDGRIVTTFDHDPRFGRLVVTDDTGARTVYDTDGAGRPNQIIHHNGELETTEYSAGGRLLTTTVTAPTARGTIRELLHLTSWGAPALLVRNLPQTARPVRDIGELQDMFGSIVDDLVRPVAGQSWNYDAHKRLTLTRDVGGLLRSYTYDALDRPRTETTAYDSLKPPELVTLSFSREGLLRSRTSEVGPGTTAVTSFTYDGLSRLRTLVRPTGLTETYEPEGASELIHRTVDGRGITTITSYDDAGRATDVKAFTRVFGPIEPDPRPIPGPSVCPPGANDGCQVRLFTHDALGQIAEATTFKVVRLGLGDSQFERRTEETHTFLHYDSLGGKTREWNDQLGEGSAVSHTFNGRGQPIDSSLAGFRFRRGYDRMGRLEHLFEGSSGALAVHFQYRGVGGPIQRRTSSGVVTSYTYDSIGRLEGLVDESARPLARWRWELPADGVPRLAGIKRGAGRELASGFQVDRGGRLLVEARGLAGQRMEDFDLRPGGFTENANSLAGALLGGLATDRRAYTLDGRHNWVERDATDNSLDTTPSLNALDGYTSFQNSAVTFAGNGAVTAIGTESYSYDLFGQPLLIGKEGITKRLRHDAFGRLIESADTAGGTAARFGWDGPRLFLVKRGSSTVVSVDGESLDEHLMVIEQFPVSLDPGQPDLDPRPDPSPGVLVQRRRFVHQERSGSVYLLTDEQGNTVETYDYTAYGERTIRSGTGAVQSRSGLGYPFGFQGQHHDADLELVFMRSRVYRPEWGRFVSTDPIGLGGGSNLYAFVMSAPMRYSDPFGLSAKALPPAPSISSSFWRAGSSFLPAHLGYAMRPPPSDAFGLIRGESIQGVQGGIGRIGLTTAAVAVGAYGVIQTGAMAGPLIVGAGGAVAEEVAIAKFAVESLAASHPGLVALGTAIAAAEGGVVLSGPVSPARLAGAGGSWRVINEIADPRIVQQLTENACGPACAQTLLREAGVEVFQSNVARAAGGVLTSKVSLAEALTTLGKAEVWKGASVTAESVGGLTRTGSWAAMLWEPGRKVGHWVIVDAVENGMVGIRDPQHATSYTMRLADFLEAWTQDAVYRIGR